ncbi:MAG TPA: hypothetical protein VGQ18_12190 [Gemmatimonadales bacterium]|jgi:hypothetical protein|nr:hypothetical protein [Gemmatimonadales bacterium]
MLVVAVLLLTVLFRFALVAVLTYVLLPRGPTCPHCSAQLTMIRNTFLQRVVPFLERRWCLECGWQGVVRRPPRTLIRG